MLRSTVALVVGLWLSPLVSGSTQDNGLDDILLADQPAPTPPPLTFNEPLPSLSWGSVPVNKTSTGSQRRLRSKTRRDRLDVRQNQCADPGYIRVCPITEHRPCCRPGFTVCCRDPSDICCPSGTFCQGTKTCCPSGSIGCGEGCCDAGTICCGATCCLSSWTCQNGACVNPQLSMRAVQSVSGVRSVQSVPLVSKAAVSSESFVRESLASLSRASASLSSRIAGQDHGDANPDTINTVLVLPSDPRIEYDSSTSWVDTTHTKGTGTCTNGTRVAEVAGASFTFPFSGSSVSIQTSASAGPVNYTVTIDEKSVVALDSTLALSQCRIITSFTQAGLNDVPHALKVVIGSGQAGKLEFSGIIYTGKGAFGTRVGGGNNRGGDDIAAFVGGAVGGSIGFLLLVALGFCLWARHRNKKKLRLKQPSMQQLDPSIEAPPVTYGGSYESAPGAAGHGQSHSLGHNSVSQPTSYSQTSLRSSIHQAAPGGPSPEVPSGMSGQNAQASSGGPSRSGPPLIQPTVPPSVQPEAISPAPRPLSAAHAPSLIWVDRARTSATSPSQHTYTIESSNSGPNSALMQGQPDADANSGATRPRSELQRPQSIHDPRYYTAADFYGLSSLSPGPLHRNGS